MTYDSSLAVHIQQVVLSCSIQNRVMKEAVCSHTALTRLHHNIPEDQFFSVQFLDNHINDYILQKDNWKQLMTIQQDFAQHTPVDFPASSANCKNIQE